MPIRVYECPVCGFTVEQIERSADYDPPNCPRAVEHEEDLREMRRVITSATPVFKGEGWAKDGYALPQRGPK